MSRARCLFYGPSFFKMKFGLNGSRWMAETAECARFRNRRQVNLSLLYGLVFVHFFWSQEVVSMF